MRIYIGNIPFRTTSEDLLDLFRSYGEPLEAEVIYYRKSKRSKGYGFVVMPSKEGQEAIRQLNDSLYQGRELRVKEALPRANYPTADETNSEPATAN